MQWPKGMEARMDAERDQAEMHEIRMDPALASDHVAGEDEAGLAATGTDGGTAVLTRRPAAGFDPADQSTWGKVPRNAACPCGSEIGRASCRERVCQYG